MNRQAIGTRLYLPLMTAILLSSLMLSTASAQSITGNYRLHGVKVQYIDVVRDTTVAVEDDNTTYNISLSWPSTAAAAAGQGFTYPLVEFAVGDTAAAPATPDALLTPAGLAAFPLGAIDLTVRLDDTNGTMTIPHHGVGTASYPTTDILACSTFAVVKDVTDAAIIALSSNSVPNTADNSITWGLGIDQSSVFAWFEAADPTAAQTTWPENWGMLKVSYTSSAFETADTLFLDWRAIDGVAADLGIDANGILNRSLGVTVLDGSDDMVPHLNTIFAGLGADFNIGTMPIIVPPGMATEVGLSEDSVISVNHAYLFDPFGGDESPLTGDEPLQFTGYYFTYNMMNAIGLVKAVVAAVLGANPTDIAGAVSAAVDTTLKTFGASATVAGAAAAAAVTTINGMITAGMDPTKALEAIPVVGIGAGLAVAKATTGTIFFSEYIEGSSNTKGLEIYNPTADTVDLADYQIAQSVNGGGWQYYHLFPAGASIAPGGVWTIANNAAVQSMLDTADETLAYPSVVHHNGDDARAIVKIGTSDTTWLDIIGDPDNDPGSNGWPVGDTTDGTKEHTMVRKATITRGNTDWLASAGTDDASSEWVVLQQDTVSGFGGHTGPTGLSGAAPWMFPDDSDHDIDLANLTAGGRLIFEVDNVCIPVQETQYVTATFTNLALETVSVDPIGDAIPSEFALYGNYPNPFNPATTFSFDLPVQTTADITIWNLLGQEVRSLHSGYLPAGTHRVTFDGRDNNGVAVPSGVYFYRLRTPEHVATKKMMLLK